MAEEYVCGECGQPMESDYCPICESRTMKLDDFDDDSYGMNDVEEDDEFETMSNDDAEGFEEGLPSAA